MSGIIYIFVLIIAIIIYQVIIFFESCSTNNTHTINGFICIIIIDIRDIIFFSAKLLGSIYKLGVNIYIIGKHVLYNIFYKKIKK
jgi:hypothetical protein